MQNLVARLVLFRVDQCLFVSGVSMFVCLFVSMFVGGPMKMNTRQVIFLQYCVLRTLKFLSCQDFWFAFKFQYVNIDQLT